MESYQLFDVGVLNFQFSNLLAIFYHAWAKFIQFFQEANDLSKYPLLSLGQ